MILSYASPGSCENNTLPKAEDIDLSRAQGRSSEMATSKGIILGNLRGSLPVTTQNLVCVSAAGHNFLLAFMKASVGFKRELSRMTRRRSSQVRTRMSLTCVMLLHKLAEKQQHRLRPKDETEVRPSASSQITHLKRMPRSVNKTAFPASVFSDTQQDNRLFVAGLEPGLRLQL